MRRKFKLKVSYTFNGCFTLRAASGKEAARLVSEQCGTVLSAIQTTLGEESEVDWHFDKHPRLAVREVIALPETLDGEKLPRVQVFHPGQRVFWRDPADETSGYYTVCSGNDDVEEPSDDDIIRICSSASEAEVFPCELRPVFKKTLKTHSNEDAGIRFPACAGNHHPKQQNHCVVQHTDRRQLLPSLSASYP